MPVMGCHIWYSNVPSRPHWFPVYQCCCCSFPFHLLFHSHCIPTTWNQSVVNDLQSFNFSMDLRIGDKYRIGRKIGSGSFGEIYLGKCTWLPLSAYAEPSGLDTVYDMFQAARYVFSVSSLRRTATAAVVRKGHFRALFRRQKGAVRGQSPALNMY
jgi:serine/threonine protein kinase